MNLIPDRLLRVLARIFFWCMPSNDIHTYNFCQQYISRFNNDNNYDIRTNGELHLLREMLPGSRTVLDVGANRGEWAAAALNINSALELHCFEPSAAAFELLIANNFPPNVVCNNFGLGSRRDDKTLYIFEEGSGCNSLYLRMGLEAYGLPPQQKTEVVHIDTIDDYCREREITQIDFLKIDVEGHELETLKGANTLLTQQRVRMVQIEYGGNYLDSRILLRDIFEFFETIGYVMHKIYPQALRPVRLYDASLENFAYQNWVAIRYKELKSTVQ